MLPIPPLDATLKERYVTCGNPACLRCRSGPAHGPYWYAYWREGDRVRSVYLGAAPSREFAKNPREWAQRALAAVAELRRRKTFAKTETTAPKARASSSPLERVLRIITKHARKSMGGLAYVPDVVRELGGLWIARPLLEELAAAGRIELRPESGLARLSAEELALTLPGPQRSRLSWMRIV